LPLAEVSIPQNFSLQYEQGWETSTTITWQPTNVMDGEALTIRQGDSLRVGAWGADSAMTSTVTVSSGGTWNFTGAETASLTFGSAGTFSVSGALQNGTTASLTVKVVPAPQFPGGVVDALESSTRKLLFPAAQEVAFYVPEDICRLIVARTATTASVSLLPSAPDQFGVAARLYDGGPILAIQRVNVIGVSDALQNDLTSIATSSISGYKIYNSPLTVLNLPAGGRIDVSIYRAGVMFPDGSTLRSIYPADLTNGWVNLEFLYPLGQPGGYCHKLLVYDRNGLYLETR
jgi:hypothetical protein